MQEGAVGFTQTAKSEVTPVGTLRNCKKSEPQLSCGDSSQPTNPKTSNKKADPERVNDESGLCFAGREKLATFQIGEQCISGVISQKVCSSDRNPVRLKSATFPKESTERRSTVDGRAPPTARPKSPDCVLPSVARALSPTHTNKPTRSIDSRLSDPWGTTYAQETSPGLPDIIITLSDGISSSEYQQTTESKPLCMSTRDDDVDHTCSAVCADDPSCVTYHTMADTIASEMPPSVSHEKQYIPSTINQAVPVSSTALTTSPLQVVTNENVSRHKKLEHISVGSALLLAFKSSASPILYNSCERVLERGHDLSRYNNDRKNIPIHVPAGCPTVSALTTALPITTAVILGRSASKYLENREKSDKICTTDQATKPEKIDSVNVGNGTVCSERNLSQTHSASSAIPVSSTTPILAQSKDNISQIKRSKLSLMSVERTQSTLRSLLRISIVPALGREVETLPSGLNKGKQAQDSVVTQQNKELSLKTTVMEPAMVAVASPPTSSPSPVMTTPVVLGDAIGNGCVELSEIDLSDDVPDTETKTNNSRSRSILDLLLCRRRE
ncbi:uncharacterized protein LOC117335239 [Pecten maximus]|uniref:uncharacterized protein LOC117335239 n=1 Tax=Pecten maximus TaxID=6579 RepID=UPI0014587C4D|nr:uncharacterized protein LOC117335239 [Pecten maximus]XP_033751131.1 uncharacterized protein LOC117335239 [Pecten maximus]XP_033751133.1 uncharacterized protein LOC117335239 [Pecten maximus]